MAKLQIWKADFKIGDKGEFDVIRYDWEVCAEGRRFTHARGNSLSRAWFEWSKSYRDEVTDHRNTETLARLTRDIRARYPDGRVVRRSSGIIMLNCEGFLWKRGDIDDMGEPRAGKSWSRCVFRPDGQDWEKEQRQHWEVLDCKVAKLSAVRTDTAAPITGASPSPQPSPDTPAPQESTRQKRTKHGIKIYSSDGEHFFYFGCWPSKKYSGRYSIRLGVAGKRMVYTIGRTDMDAMLWELQRLLPVQTPVPQIVPTNAETPQNMLHRVRTA